MNGRNADIAILYGRAYVVLTTAITVNHRMDAWACPKQPLGLLLSARLP